MLLWENGMNNKKVKVSIVVPVYNTERYLHRCLKSICNQTLREIEVILIDDGSFDGSGQICDEYSAIDERVHVIHQTHGGQVSARWTGLATASAGYIGFVDSDDWIESDMYHALYEMVVCSGADIVAEGIVEDIGGECWRSRNLLPEGRYGTVEEKEGLYRGMVSCKDYFGMGIQPYLCNKLFRRKFALLHMNKVPRSIRVGEDAAAVYSLFAQAGTVVLSNTAHYHYCHRSTSMMLGNRQEEREYENAVMLHSFLGKAFAEAGIYEVMREQLRRYTVNNLLTRAYGKFAEIDRESALFPFVDVSQNDSFVIYGAGAFGKAVYQYAVGRKGLKVEAWIDQKAAAYRKLGLDVSGLDDIQIDSKHKIIVAVFSEAAYWKIREKLIEKGVALDQIKWIDTEKISDLLAIE